MAAYYFCEQGHQTNSVYLLRSQGSTRSPSCCHVRQKDHGRGSKKNQIRGLPFQNSKYHIVYVEVALTKYHSFAKLQKLKEKQEISLFSY